MVGNQGGSTQENPAALQSPEAFPHSVLTGLLDFNVSFFFFIKALAVPFETQIIYKPNIKVQIVLVIHNPSPQNPTISFTRSNSQLKVKIRVDIVIANSVN